MSTDAVTLAAIADTGAVLDVLAGFAAGIDYSTSVAAATSASGAVDLSQVAGLSILADIAMAQANLAQSVAVPATLASTLVALIQEFQSTSVDFRVISDAAATITWASQSPAAGLGQAEIAANRAALAGLLATQGLIEAVRAATSATYPSQQAALAMRDDLADRLDAASAAPAGFAGNPTVTAGFAGNPTVTAGFAGNPTVTAGFAGNPTVTAGFAGNPTVTAGFAGNPTNACGACVSRPLRAALDGLRVALVTDINSRAAALATLETFTPAAVLPALVLAQMLYDEPTMAPDICARNGVAHPGFVPAAQLTVVAP